MNICICYVVDEILNESESSDKGGHENQEDEESFINGQMDQLEQERQSIMNNKAMNSEVNISPGPMVINFQVQNCTHTLKSSN